ncbi:MAG TPA: oxidoreductase [Prolixibacteraceae bacterium]|nr:oxidoreductase [Prolixibacteraceae bacterium]HCU63831.1 oxidoreductase [Prolixibacteraceae bacterium]
MMTDVKQQIKIDESFYKVENIRKLTDNTISLSLPGSRFKYKAGQHISLGIHGNYQSREYSIYSGANDKNLEVLVKEVKDGYFSPKLSHLKPGDLVEVHGPFGKFFIDEKLIPNNKFVFIASGTGIAPFRSMVRTHANLDYTLIHGVRYSNEAYDKHEYAPGRHILCTTGDKNGNYHGRLTGYLNECSFAENTHFYLCGNSNMIFDALEILKEKGFDRDHIHCEVYF